MIARLTRRTLLAAGSTLALSFTILPAAAQDTLTLAWSPAPQMPQIDVALAENMFAEAGLDVSIIRFASGREAFEALTGGQADLATMAELPAVTGALRDQKFAVIADLARYTGSRVITKASTGIDSPADLSGQRVGVTLGTNTDFFLGKVLETAGVSAEIVNAAPPDLLPALVRGDVDAIVPFPNVYPAARQTLGDDYREMRSGLYDPHYILAASPAALSDKADAVSRFVATLVKADGMIEQDPDKAAGAVVETVQGNIDAEAVKSIWQDTKIGVQLDTSLPELMAKEGAWIVGHGVVNAEVPTANTLRPFLDPQPLRSTAPGAVTLD